MDRSKRGHARLSRLSRYKASRFARDPCREQPLPAFGESNMLKWAIIFAVVSLITGWMGFRGVSGATATIAKVLFVCFVILFLLALLAVIGVLHLF
jgi:uncharacterized membrane protein YtjA (UPF0391 family)